ncbi:hypothetical protein G6F70_009013 [Rhizopus microsporus]|uniref:Uncharacterized protein n=1 Tax=Rhizopus microsporus TaxID=58291 RepID=A0A0A1PBV2_RHIZD|nr:hypothetical protein G6F71_005222 [Rhizopus microsporus]KAG1193779.1 hypothetical protein G6F70_009013 [Rhizopus microsporus]KAG1206212.1 hypothetical protein G6F69_008995 [Rhizopus microsporus]KAG1234170.1 hypothetical protein G6F67_003713 [Rhizopus microsporus]KAG1258020.1 hypothetical protein G6F68_009001 [Rhizopus microsporus]
MNRLISLSTFTSKHALFRQQYTMAIGARRAISSTIHCRQNDVSTKTELEESMNHIEELFSIAKDELEYAEESQGTTYYHEERVAAEKAVKEVMSAYDTFLSELPSEEMRKEVETRVGMKMKELQMTFNALPDEEH